MATVYEGLSQLHFTNEDILALNGKLACQLLGLLEVFPSAEIPEASACIFAAF